MSSPAFFYSELFMSVFEEVLRLAIIRDQKTRTGPFDYFYPSNIGICDRALILKRLGLPEHEIDERVRRLFWMGHRIHQSLQEAIKTYEALEVLGHEVRVRDEAHQVSGKMDTLVKNKGELETWEFKSIHSRAYKHGELPYVHHILQLGIYLTFPWDCPNYHKETDSPEVLWTMVHNDYIKCGICGQNILRNPPNPHPRLPPPEIGRLIYWSKDDLLIREFVVKLTPELRAEVKKELLRLCDLWKKYQDTGQLPPKPIRSLKDEWKASRCDFRGTGKCCSEELRDMSVQA